VCGPVGGRKGCGGKETDDDDAQCFLMRRDGMGRWGRYEVMPRGRSKGGPALTIIAAPGRGGHTPRVGSVVRRGIGD
jgi:hypothetical protein